MAGDAAQPFSTLVYVGTQTVERDFGALLVDRRKVRQALDVVPVQVREQEVKIAEQLPLCRQLFAQAHQAGARVNDQPLAGIRANINARGIATVAHGVRPWDRIASAYSPKNRLHRWYSDAVQATAEAMAATVAAQAKESKKSALPGTAVPLARFSHAAPRDTTMT